MKRLLDSMVKRYQRVSFLYLGPIIHKNGEIDKDVNHKIRARWVKRTDTSKLFFYCRMPNKLKGKFYKITRLAMLYGTKCWAIKKHHIHKMNVTEMRMLRWKDEEELLEMV